MTKSTDREPKGGKGIVFLQPKFGLDPAVKKDQGAGKWEKAGRPDTKP